MIINWIIKVSKDLHCQLPKPKGFGLAVNRKLI